MGTVNPPFRRNTAIGSERTPLPVEGLEQYSPTNESVADSGITSSSGHRYPLWYKGRPSSATSSYQKRPRIDHNELAEMEDRFYTLTMFYNQLQHQEVTVGAELNTT